MIFELLNGKRLNASDFGLTRLFHHIPTMEITHKTNDISGLGSTITSTTLGQRTIKVDFVFEVNNIYDYYLLRDELNGVFARSEAFYIIFEREPYKRWLVKLNSGFTMPPNPVAGEFSIEFRTIKKYAESIVDTSNMVKTWESEQWGWNNTLDWNIDPKYNFEGRIAEVYNLGNVHIDPSEYGVELEIDIVAETNQPLTITNETTGDVYIFNDLLTSSDRLKINKLQTHVNGTSKFKSTNKKLLTLAPGLNRIVIDGGVIYSTKFKFRFLYY